MAELGRTHNLWLRMTMLLEQMAYDPASLTSLVPASPAADDCYEFEPTVGPDKNTLVSGCLSRSFGKTQKVAKNAKKNGKKPEKVVQ